MNFKQFLINEDTRDLANRIGDIYNALQNLGDIAQKKGKATIVATQNIVGQIRKIIRSMDVKEHKEHLEKLSNIGVMLLKSIDGKNDISLEDALSKSNMAIKNIVNKLGSPINDIASADIQKTKDDKGTSDKIKKSAKAVVPPSDQSVIQPTSPGGPPQQEVPTLGGSTGDLKNI